MKQSHLMFDLETLGTTADAVVLSIGAVFGVEGSKEFKTFEIHLHLDDQLKPGPTQRRVDASTLLWWFNQDNAPRQNQIEAGRSASVEEGVALFIEWVESVVDRNTLVWGNGSDFDTAILMHLFKQHGFTSPWMFWNHRCFRTLKALFKAEVPQPAQNDHIAVNDAVNQMTHLFMIEAHRKQKAKA